MACKESGYDKKNHLSGIELAYWMIQNDNAAVLQKYVAPDTAPSILETDWLFLGLVR